MAVRPYAVMAEKMGLTEEEVLARLTRLKEIGIIRRLGGIFNSRKLGYVGTLCAAKVPPGRVDEVARIVNSYVAVTHNYIREHEYNMWFTVLALSWEELDRIVAEIKEQAGIEHLLNLPAQRMFKVNVHFEVTEVQDAE